MKPNRSFLYRAVTILGAAASVAATSCYTTVVKTGTPAAPATVEYDEKWHSGLIYGLAELSGPYDLSRICPGGWAEIKTETSFLNGLVQGLTFNIYNPQSVTVRCTAGAPGPNVSGGAPPAVGTLPPSPAPAPAGPPPTQ